LDNSDDPIVCIAGGSGLSVIKALLEHAASLSVARDAILFYGAKTQQDLYSLDEIEDLKHRWNSAYKLETVYVLSDEDNKSPWEGPRGFVTDYISGEYLKDNEMRTVGSRIYICGPPPMIDAAVLALGEVGVADERIYLDKFEDARSPAPVIDNRKCILCDECLIGKPVANCIVETAGFVMDGAQEIIGSKPIEPGLTSGLYYNSLYINESACIRCMACVVRCPVGAISTSNTVRPEVLRDMRVEYVVS
jgi:ferredoxin-NADP reductase